MTTPRLVVTPLLEAELTAAPTAESIERWRRRIAVTADPSTVLGALLGRFDGLSVEHRGVHATVRWFGSTALAGENSVVALVELSTREAQADVLALDRGHDRVLAAPVAADAEARMRDALREAIEVYGRDELLPEACFFGAVCEFLADVPRRITARTPDESLGRWVLEHAAAAIAGEVCERPLARGQKLSVQLRTDESSRQPAKDGIRLAPLVVVRRLGARGKILDEMEQPVSLGLVGTDTMYEPLPDDIHRNAALDVLKRWKEQLADRIARLPLSEAKSLMPMDLPWPTSPMALAIQTLRHGAPGPRPCAGALGPLAQATASSLRELDANEMAALERPEVVRAYRAGTFTLMVRHRDDGERIEESLWARRDGGRSVALVFWLEEDRLAISSDGDEPALRLFSEWMRRGLETCALDRPLPTGVLLSQWLLFQDRDGDPLDHRVTEGAISARGYDSIDDLLSADEIAGSATHASETFRSLVRELIDPDARFGQRVAELGLP